MISSLHFIGLGFGASLAAGIATGVGSLPAFLFRRPSDKVMDAMLGFAAGVMLAVTAFGLIVPAIDEGGIWVTVGGLALGVAFLELMDRSIPHMHFISGPEGPSSRLRRIWLLVLAITIHNMPEGLAVGVSFGSQDLGAATALALGIGLQNMPEGLAVALPLVREGYAPGRAVWYATLTGLVEPVVALLGVSLVIILAPLLPLGLAFAAGAMLYVVADEIIPESHRKGHEKEATLGTVVGFGLMMTLDSLLG
jgi:ZIP family zinc transporter